MSLCEYGCDKEAKYQLKNNKWCCSEKWQKCPGFKKKISMVTSGENNPNYGNKHSEETKEKIRKKTIGREAWNKGKERSNRVKKILSEKLKGREPWNKGKMGVYSKETIEKMKSKVVNTETRKKLSLINKISIETIFEKYPIFSKEEEMRYNPDVPTEEKEIQVHCKNHNCPNSKEHDGWFTPTGTQFYERIRQIEKGNDGSYLYCSEECKQECPLYNLRSDPYQNIYTQYTQEEYTQFREFVLERDNYCCQYCGNKAEHVHHERPQKLEPFFSLDPDLAWSVCITCHYKYGHKDECSTGNLAKQICL